MKPNEYKHKLITTDTGVTLERRYCYLQPKYFALLEHLAREQNCSISLIIESALNSIPDQGKHDNDNSSTN